MEFQSNELCSNISTKPSPPEKAQFGNCRICHDKASGVHYGVVTCEGCKVSLCNYQIHVEICFNLLNKKGFYKRSASRKRLYFCLNKNKCNVTVDNRKNCKACRYKKCIDEGMGVEGK